MAVSYTFHRARIVWLPLGRPDSVCVTVGGGVAPLSFTVLKSRPSTKYSQLDVRWKAVSVHWNVCVLPMLVRGQASEPLSRVVKRLPPEQSIDPFGASTLCGSHSTPLQDQLTVRLAQWSCRLGG